MYQYQTGQKITNPSADGVLFDLSDSGATLLIAMRNPTAEEKRAFKSGVQQFRFAVVHDIIFFLCRFGAQPWMDAPYYKHLSRPFHIDLPAEGQGIAMHAMMVDATTGILIAQKLIGLPHDLSVKLLQAVDAQPQIEYYDVLLPTTMELYTTADLLKVAEA